MLKVTLLDPSTVDIPDQPLTARTRASDSTHSTSAWRSIPLTKPRTNKSQNSSRESTKSESDSPLVANVHELNLQPAKVESNRKWAEPMVEQRDLRLRKTLESRRSKKSRDSPNESLNRSTEQSDQSHGDSGSNGVTEVVTYPRFIVTSSQNGGKPLKQGRGTRRTKAYSDDDTSTEEEATSSNRKRTRRVRNFLSLDNLYPVDDDNIVGFYPDNMEDLLKAKAVGNDQRRLVQRTHSPSVVHQPPPTPSSTQPTEHQLNHQPESQEKRNGHQARSRVKEGLQMRREASEPGISNTTQLLLERNIRKSNFSFPDLPATDRRTNQMTTARSSSDLQQHEDLNNSQSTSNKEHHNPEFVRSKTYVGNDVKVSTQAPRDSKQKFSRMMALGLPKVSLDIDKNYFSRENQTRRSLKLREMYNLQPETLRGVRSDNHTLPVSQTARTEMASTEHNATDNISGVDESIMNGSIENGYISATHLSRSNTHSDLTKSHNNDSNENKRHKVINLDPFIKQQQPQAVEVVHYEIVLPHSTKIKRQYSMLTGSYLTEKTPNPKVPPHVKPQTYFTNVKPGLGRERTMYS